ncbi:MAG: sulfatase-like hydrolase/transferase [Phenylobacterium sp.]|uniref:sulfatase-like hydrolase/transferase n=1 Tax=Phenylobacterium sp. TaxID=1871053 RepID=UPI001A3F651C|nr:sulfatase-like hydrolase/transferase [Phenylobacterium sp.]MBL8773313.1 sulfatase-like hydrolase/transferase [Phenylobacterium sp.]
MIQRIKFRLAASAAVAAVLATAAGASLSGGARAQAPAAPKAFGPAEVGPPMEITWQQGPDRPRGGRRPPNIVLIVADDLGYNDLTVNGGGVAGGAVPTPNIDSIAREGVNFAQGYAGHGTCAPSRAAILTGRYPTRFGFEFTPAPPALGRNMRTFNYGIHNGVSFPEREKDMIPFAKMGLPQTEITLADLLQRAGYHTLHFGKWHLGEAPEFGATRRGFKESLLTSGSMYLPKDDPRVVNSMQDFDPIDRFLWQSMPFYAQKDGGPGFRPKAYLTDYLTDEAVKAIHANRNRPFFAYLAYNAPHTPLQATKADYAALSHIKDHRMRVYAAMIRALDRGVGRVLQQLEEDGLKDNTLVVFVSDNGGAGYVGLPDINRPFRGWKLTYFEGGVRTPYLMRWPAAIPAGSAYRAPVSHFDIFATAAAAARVPLPRDRVIDGVDLVPYVTGKARGRPHENLFWRSGDYQVVRAGDWKLQVTDRPDKDWLFDLANDPTERINLAAAMPGKVAELKRLLARHNAAQVKPLWPQLGLSPVMLDHTLAEPQTAEDEYVYWGG